MDSSYKTHILTVDSLPASSIHEMAALYLAHYDGSSQTLFRHDLARKDEVILIRHGGKVVGFSTLKLYATQWKNHPIRILYSGITIIHRQHWGQQQALTFTWLSHAGRIWRQNQALPLYWFLLVKGHRTYRYLPIFARSFHPHWSAPRPDLKPLADRLAIDFFGANYDFPSGTVRFARSRGHLKAELAEASGREMDNPVVRHFMTRNPGFRQGEADALFAGRPVAFERTGGSTAGPKLIPYSREGLEEIRLNVSPWVSRLIKQHALDGSVYFATSPVARNTECMGDIRVGLPDTAYLDEKTAHFIQMRSAVPFSVSRISNIDKWRRTTVNYLKAARDLELISIWSPTFLLRLLEQIPDARTRWPRLKLISCWTAGPSRRYAEEVAALFPHASIEPKGLISTEAVFTIPDSKGRPILAPNGYFEFLAGDRLPMPGRRIFREKRYLPIRFIETGRGCRFRCEFCSVPHFFRPALLRPAHSGDHRQIRNPAAHTQAILFHRSPVTAGGQTALHAWWLDERYRYNEVAFMPECMTPQDITRHCVESRRRFYAWPSILKRALGNRHDPFMLRNFIPINAMHHNEITMRHSFPFGDETEMPPLPEVA